jgi:hypothetical protein
MICQINFWFALIFHFLQFLVSPSHLYQVLFGLELVDVLHDIFSHRLRFMNYILVFLLVLNNHKILSYFFKNIIKQ